jgi:hypothetical protein
MALPQSQASSVATNLHRSMSASASFAIGWNQPASHSYVRYAPIATKDGEPLKRRDGPISDIAVRFSIICRRVRCPARRRRIVVAI